MILLLFFTVLPMALIKKMHETGNPAMFAPSWFQGLTHATALFANFALGPGLALAMVWIARHQRLGWKWPLAASAIIALVGFHMIARFADVPGGRGQVSIGVLQVLRIFGHYSPTPHWQMLAQFFLTLAPALWLLNNPSQSAPESTRSVE